jgi:hypothetical protein
VLLPDNTIDDDDDDEADRSILPESISISRIDDLLSQMRFHEVPKRAQFSIPFELASGFVIGAKGYSYRGVECPKIIAECNSQIRASNGAEKRCIQVLCGPWR